MTSERLEYHRTAERPALEFWLQDADGDLLDLATGSTFEFKLGTIDGGPVTAFTKTTGITGATGTGTEYAGTPNVTIAFVAGELDPVAAGTYTWQLRVTTSGLDRVYQGWVDLLDVLP